MQQEKFIIASKMDKTPLSVLMVTPDGAPKGLVQFSPAWPSIRSAICA